MGTRGGFTRRAALGGALAAGLAARTAWGAGAGRTAARFTPAGGLARRVALTTDRLLRGKDPAFTDEMVLADIHGDRRRRFAEWSGDLSGRFLEALARMPGPAVAGRAAHLARAILRGQRPDGRFGDTALAFTPEAIDRPHMSLLWGNGRLLVGLLEHHRATADADTLAAARRLGDFLLEVGEACHAPPVRAKLQGAAAQGLICYTQIAEGLALLGGRTGEGRYHQAARAAVSLLEPRGRQHSHGYLSTLRGALAIHEAAGDAAALETARRRFDELVASPDYLVMGGVAEYFGGEPQRLGRDEGCSEADFLRLALGLWRATGEARYLDLAERCLLNAFFFNQWATGDFGHHVLSPRGSRTDDGAGRAWWCCTAHGYRAFGDVFEAAVGADGDRLRVDLYLPGRWSDGGRALEIEEGRPAADGRLRFLIKVPGRAAPVAFRRPSWAASVELRADGRPVEARDEGGALVPALRGGPASLYEVTLAPRTRLVTRSGEELPSARLGDEPREAALFHGPWLLAADDELDPAFFGEPWTANVLALGTRTAGARTGAADAHPFAVPGARLRLRYQPAGFDQPGTVVLRPIAEQTSRPLRGVLAWWLRFRA